MKWIFTKERVMPAGQRVILKYKSGDIDFRKFHSIDKEWIQRNVECWLDESPTPLEPMYSEAELVECLQWAALEGFKARENGPGFILWEILKKPVNGLFPVIPEYDKYDTKDLVQLWIKTRIPSLPVIKK